MNILLNKIIMYRGPYREYPSSPNEGCEIDISEDIDKTSERINGLKSESLLNQYAAFDEEDIVNDEELSIFQKKYLIIAIENGPYKALDFLHENIDSDFKFAKQEILAFAGGGEKELEEKKKKALIRFVSTSLKEAFYLKYRNLSQKQKRKETEIKKGEYGGFRIFLQKELAEMSGEENIYSDDEEEEKDFREEVIKNTTAMYKWRSKKSNFREDKENAKNKVEFLNLVGRALKEVRMKEVKNKFK